MGTVRNLWIKRSKRGPMDPRETATLVAGKGIAGNANQGGRRQVVLVPEEGWEKATAELGTRIDDEPARRPARRPLPFAMKVAHPLAREERDLDRPHQLGATEHGTRRIELANPAPK